MTADRIMREPNEQEIASFTKAAKALAKLGSRGFYLYLAEDTLHLMVGPSHDEKCVPRDERVRATVRIPQSGGGAW